MDVRNAFNAGHPRDDRANFRDDMVSVLTAFYPAGRPGGVPNAAQAGVVANLLLPDILVFDPTSTAGFFGDRRHARRRRLPGRRPQAERRHHQHRAGGPHRRRPAGGARRRPQPAGARHPERPRRQRPEPHGRLHRPALPAGRHGNRASARPCSPTSGRPTAPRPPSPTRPARSCRDRGVPEAPARTPFPSLALRASLVSPEPAVGGAGCARRGFHAFRRGAGCLLKRNLAAFKTYRTPHPVLRGENEPPQPTPPSGDYATTPMSNCPLSAISDRSLDSVNARRRGYWPCLSLLTDNFEK